MEQARLERLLFEARRHTLHTVLAGGIQPDDCGKIPSHLVDMIAVRGAVCPTGRQDRVDQQLVAGLLRLLRADPAMLPK